ncbi:loricrin-like [Bacillus rossius redtenbacheri]|uniref:loricrin-like n=1 Tax=Bacillus rossius redtenbacheri TaxID=93214 RepID=UPI002FDC8289
MAATRGWTPPLPLRGQLGRWAALRRMAWWRGMDATSAAEGAAGLVGGAAALGAVARADSAWLLQGSCAGRRRRGAWCDGAGGRRLGRCGGSWAGGRCRGAWCDGAGGHRLGRCGGSWADAASAAAGVAGPVGGALAHGAVALVDAASADAGAAGPGGGAAVHGAMRMPRT